MGSKVSKPARKLTGTISHASDIAKPTTSRIQLPSKELKDRFENSVTEPANKKVANSSDSEVRKNDLLSRSGDSELPKENVPEGKDGMDPQADQSYINFINNLGRQIHSHSEGSNPEQVNVRALKQLLDRKNLYKKGQDEVKAQLESSSGARTMIHPRTLTGILYALNDPRVSYENVMKDYQVDAEFMKNLDRFKVAENVVIIEEQAKEDEIGPKVGQPVARAATDPSLMNENGSVSESVNQERLKELRSRLE